MRGTCGLWWMARLRCRYLKVGILRRLQAFKHVGKENGKQGFDPLGVLDHLQNDCKVEREALSTDGFGGLRRGEDSASMPSRVPSRRRSREGRSPTCTA